MANGPNIFQMLLVSINVKYNASSFNICEYHLLLSHDIFVRSAVYKSSYLLTYLRSLSQVS